MADLKDDPNTWKTREINPSYSFLFQLCDIVLRVGVTTLSAHRVVLAATSPYFHAMFNGKTIQIYSGAGINGHEVNGIHGLEGKIMLRRSSLFSK